MKKNKLNILLFLFVIAISFFLLLFFNLENDYFWHIKAGEVMFNKGVLTHDIFSWYLKGKYWMSHEWLFEIILFSLKKIFGDIHTIVYCFICLISLLLILFKFNEKNILKNIPFTLMFYLILVSLSLGFIQARPHMISNILLALTIYFLYDLYINKDSKKIYFLPIISIIWSNVHGGSSNLVYLLCLVFFITGLFNFKYKKMEANKFSKIQLRKYFIVMILCMIGICINIHGFKMFLYPYQNMADSVMINNIVEWQSTSLNNLYHYIYYFSIIFFIIIMLISNKKIQLIDLMLFGVCTYLGLKGVRFWFYTPIIMNYVIFNYVDNRKLDNGTYTIISILIIALFGTFIINCNRIFNIKYSKNINKEILSVIHNEDPKRLFNMYDYGGELIYNNVDVFIDGRADLYSKYNYKDYLNISTLDGDYIKLINKYNFDLFIVDNKYPINTYLKYSEEYRKVYNNKKISIYKKIVN